jgi:hypothetical protein
MTLDVWSSQEHVKHSLLTHHRCQSLNIFISPEIKYFLCRSYIVATIHDILLSCVCISSRLPGTFSGFHFRHWALH